MDLVSYDEDVFYKIKEDYLAFTKFFPIKLNIDFIPISALNGDNIIRLSEHMTWYNGSTLINMLDTIKIIEPIFSRQCLRFPVQYVNYDHLDFRGYSGTIASGELYVGKKIKVFPSGEVSSVRRIVIFKEDILRAVSGDPITIVLENDFDITRGNIFLDIDDDVSFVNSAQVDIVWMGSENLVKGSALVVQIAHRRVRAYVKFLYYQLDVNNSTYLMVDYLPFNGIGLVDLIFDEFMILDPYSYSSVTGGMIFIDPYTNFTIGAGMVRFPLKESKKKSDILSEYSEFEKEFHSLIRRYFPHWNLNDLLSEM